MNPDGTWRVTVGVRSSTDLGGELRLLVERRSRRAHLFHLLGQSELLPRLDATKAAAGTGEHLWELVCRWLVDTLEVVLRRDLVRDYVPFCEALEAARGQIDAVATADAYYSGRLHLVCDFEEFGSDAELNRVLKAAALAVGASVDVSASTRRRAIRIAARMEDVGEVRPSDLRATLDRRTAHYADALALARSVLANIRRTLKHGEAVVWTFLIRTPELVEAGVRNELPRTTPREVECPQRDDPLAGGEHLTRCP